MMRYYNSEFNSGETIIKKNGLKELFYLDTGSPQSYSRTRICKYETSEDKNNSDGIPDDELELLCSFRTKMPVVGINKGELIGAPISCLDGWEDGWRDGWREG